MKSIGLSLVIVGVGAVAWSATSRTVSAEDRFFLRPIAASAVHHSWQAPHIRNKDGTSSNWGGYAVETNLSSPQSGAVSDVKGTWVVPSVTASTSANTYSSSWVGIDGYSDGTVEQLGTEQDWTPSGPVYYAWFEMYPKFGYEIVGFPVNPGDTISAEVQYLGNGAFKLSIRNVSKNVSFSTNQRNKSARLQSAEWIEEAPYSGGVLPLADFGTINFSGCNATLNGLTGSISTSTWQKDAITMATSSGTIKAQPSGLSTNGTSFSMKWYHE